MIGVITGDIVNSRKVANPDEWLSKLKTAFSNLGSPPKTWEIIRGDSFQAEIVQAQTALREALYIKALVKCIAGLDVRMAIGVGSKTYDAPKISEANGEAFVHSGRLFDQLKKNTLALKSPWQEVDKAINTCLELALLTMDRWTPNSAEIVVLSMQNPDKTQSELGSMIGISQGRVSERQQRAGYEEIMKMEAYFRELVKQKTTG
ncbi:sigma factor-like helix-turn-helix DNA-binding protein [Parapedobacter sp. DT-150]|uniref:sigma factor-like helix-turn-helix DNA-binding protein n=1 Tax=Parapedobacter sp. DT-150 TaxID=3396162 RepID=UPI003F1DCC21